jgi:hypothetical protein
MRERILKIRRRRRKAQQRLQALYKENTARLYRKAQTLSSEDENWWDSVRLELEQVIAQRESEIATIRAKIEMLEPIESQLADRDS